MSITFTLFKMHCTRTPNNKRLLLNEEHTMITIEASQLKRSTRIRQNLHPIQVVFVGSYGCTYCVKLARLVHNTPACIKHDFNLSPFKIELTQAQAQGDRLYHLQTE